MKETDKATGVYGETWVVEMDRATGSIDSGDSRVDKSHHASNLVSHIISSHYKANYTLYLSHHLISLTPSEAPCGATQLRGSPQLGIIIPSHPLPMLLEPEPLFRTNSFGMPREVRQRVDDGPSVV